MHLNVKKYVFTRLGFGAQMVHIEFMCGLITLVSRLLRMTLNPARGHNSNKRGTLLNQRLAVFFFIIKKRKA